MNNNNFICSTYVSAMFQIYPFLFYLKNVLLNKTNNFKIFYVETFPIYLKNNF